MLVVVLIIGILAAVALPQYTRAVEKAKATEALTVAKSIYEAQRRYFLENNTYASNFDELDVQLPAEYNTKVSDGNYQSDSFNAFLFTYAVYINKIPSSYAIAIYTETSGMALKVGVPVCRALPGTNLEKHKKTCKALTGAATEDAVIDGSYFYNFK